MKREETELSEPTKGFTKKRILNAIRESGKRGLSVYELSWLTGADIFFILKALKQLKRDLISSGFVSLCTGVIRSGRWHSG